MSDIFISYASADRERATLLSKALQRRGRSVWWDRTIPPGKEYDQVIEEALDSAQCVVVLWSHASVASSWVKTEAAEAMRRKILVPALIEDVKIPLEFRRLQAADLSRWQGEPDHPGLEEFFQSIDRKIHGSGVIENPPIPPVSSPEQPRLAIQPGQRTRAAWPAFALIAAVVVVASGITLWRSQQDQSAPSVPPQEVDCGCAGGECCQFCPSRSGCGGEPARTSAPVSRCSRARDGSTCRHKSAASGARAGRVVDASNEATIQARGQRTCGGEAGRAHAFAGITNHAPGRGSAGIAGHARTNHRPGWRIADGVRGDRVHRHEGRRDRRTGHDPLVRHVRASS